MYQELKLLYDWRIYMIFVSGTLIVIRLADLYDFICREQKSLTTLRLLSVVWIVVVENSTGSVHHVQKPLNLSHTSPESHDLLFLDRFVYQEL